MSNLLSIFEVSIDNANLYIDNVKRGNREKMKIKIDLNHQTHVFITCASAMCLSIF